MKKIILLILTVIILLNFSCIADLDKKIDNKLLYVKNNNIIMLNITSNVESKICKINTYNYEVFPNEVIFAYKDDQNQNMILKAINIKNKSIRDISKLARNAICGSLIRVDDNNLLVTLRFNHISKYKLDIRSGIKNDIGSINEYDLSIYKYYNKQNLYMTIDTVGDVLYKIVHNNTVLYQGDNQNMCYYPNFLSESKISFSLHGNIYIYYVKTQKMYNYTDFPEEKWSTYAENGYRRYTWSKKGYLATEYSEDNNSEIRIFSPDKKIIKTIPDAFNPKWIE